MITTSSPILGKGGTVEEAMVFLDGPDATDAEYAGTLFRLCQETGIDYRVAFAQFCVETANGTSPRWLTNRNPAGLAVVSDGDPDPAKWDGTDAAKAHVWALLRATGTLARQDFDLPLTGQRFFDRWSLKYRAPQCPKVVTVADLCRHYTDANGEQQATWAWDTTYADQIVAKANATFKGDPVVTTPSTPATGDLNMTKGLIPFPSFIDSLVLDNQTNAYDLLGTRSVCAFVFHRMLGGWKGTDVYFHNHAPGLTDFGQEATTGEVFRWNDPDGAAHTGVSANRTPWASGPYNVNGDAYGDGVKLANRFGVNGVNRNALSWEISGQYGDPWSDDAIAVCAQALAANAHEYGIRWDTFPYIPDEDRNFTVFHQEITGPSEKVCPGLVVVGCIGRVISEAQAIMKQAQTGGKDVPVTPTPKPTPAPEQKPIVPGLHLPPGLTTPFLERAFAGNGLEKISIGGRTFSFNPAGSVSKEWLTRALATIPSGGDYTKGKFPALTQVISRGKRGSGGVDFVFSDGSVIHKDAAPVRVGHKG